MKALTKLLSIVVHRHIGITILLFCFLTGFAQAADTSYSFGFEKERKTISFEQLPEFKFSKCYLVDAASDELWEIKNALKGLSVGSLWDTIIADVKSFTSSVVDWVPGHKQVSSQLRRVSVSKDFRQVKDGYNRLSFAASDELRAMRAQFGGAGEFVNDPALRAIRDRIAKGKVKLL